MKLPTNEWDVLFAPMTWLFILAIIIFFIVGLYDIGQSKNHWSFFKKIILAMAIWLLFGIIYFYLRPRNNVQPKTIMLLCTAAGALLVSAWRAIYNRFLSVSILKTNIVFVGLTDETIEIINKLEDEPETGYEVIGIVASSDESSRQNLKGANKYFIADNLAELMNRINKPIGYIIVTPTMAQNTEVAKELYHQLVNHISTINFVTFYEEVMKRIPPSTFSESWFLANLQEQDKKIYDRFKIIVDFVFAALMSIVFIITFPLVAIIIKLSSPGPVFFSQERTGRHGSTFKIYKYRTMKALTKDGSAETDGARFAAENDQRITGIGKFLRKARIDELPQFINIFRNEMSLIGPRPERPEFVEQLTARMPYYSLRHLIKPGLTGWAQIKKSYYGTIDENLHKLEYDLYYLKNRGPLLDATIVLRTFKILGRMAGR